MMTDEQIHAAVQNREIILDPFDPNQVEPASYDIRVGNWAFTSSSKEKLNLSEKGVVIVEPGEFAVVESRERVELDRRTAAQLGLRSEFARRGLLVLSGPQIDPGFKGVLVVRLINLAPKRIALGYETPFLTAQFFRLSTPVAKPYSGPQQGQPGITGKDIQELTETESLTLGQVIKTLSTLARDVAKLEGSVSKLVWSMPVIVGLGLTIIGIIVVLK